MYRIQETASVPASCEKFLAAFGRTEPNRRLILKLAGHLLFHNHLILESLPWSIILFTLQEDERARQKALLNIKITFNDSPRRGRGGRRPRANRGGRMPSGGGRGERRGPREAAPRFDDENDFPSLGVIKTVAWGPRTQSCLLSRWWTCSVFTQTLTEMGVIGFNTIADFCIYITIDFLCTLLTTDYLVYRWM